MTVLDLIKRSMRLCGALAVSDQPTADEQADAFAVLNLLIDAWGAERLTMWTTARTVYSAVAGVQQYALGPNTSGTDWLGARPIALNDAGIVLAATPAAYERPLHIIRTDDEWARVRIKSLPGTLPTKLYFQPDSPAATIILWPAPQAAVQVALYTPSALSAFTGLTQTVALPPAYARALTYNLAVEYAAEFGGDPSQTVVAIAIDSYEKLKRANAASTVGRLRVDRALLRAGGRAGGQFDVYLGEDR